MQNILWGVGCVVGYLIGSLPFGIWIPRLFKKADPRQVGSGSIGTSNVYRASGLMCAIFVGCADILKGFIPVYYALSKGASQEIAFTVGLCCVLGHMWPCFAAFKGGKGVATAAGVLLPFMPGWILGATVLWIAMARMLGYAVWASIFAILITVLGSFLSGVLPTYPLFVLSLALPILMKHRKNFQRWKNRKEHKVTREHHKT